MNCPYCGNGMHAPEMCYMIKKIEYYENGALKSVEKKEIHSYPVFPNLPMQPYIPPYVVTCGDGDVPYGGATSTIKCQVPFSWES